MNYLNFDIDNAPQDFMSLFARVALKLDSSLDIMQHDTFGYIIRVGINVNEDVNFCFRACNPDLRVAFIFAKRELERAMKEYAPNC